MNLYTESQVREMLGKSRLHSIDDTEMFTDDYLIEQQKPIELPTDEEIEKQSFDHATFSPSYIAGAKWMKEQIIKK